MLIDQVECRCKFSIFKVHSCFKRGKGGGGGIASQFVAHCITSMDSTQSRLDFEREEDMDSLHLPPCARQRSGSKNFAIHTLCFKGIDILWVESKF